MKEKVLALLKQSEGYLSGEEMSRTLGVSRSAVWKVIQQLEKQGYEIESKTRLGYRLAASPDILFTSEFREFLNTRIIGKKIQHVQNTPSTNDLAKQYAAAGGEEGYVVLSENQTRGRGRGGGSWLSSISRGVYLSVVLRPPGPLCRAVELSLLVSCAVRDTLEEAVSLPFETGWPGDLFCQGKKVCGILIESAGELEKLDYCVAGIGINVNFNQEDFAQEKIESATSLKLLTSQWYDRKQLVPLLLNRLDSYYEAYLNGDFSAAEEYQKHCATLGRQVKVGAKTGRCTGISPKGELLACLEDGTQCSCWPGEATV